MRLAPLLTTAALALAVPAAAHAGPPAQNPHGKPNPGAQHHVDKAAAGKPTKHAPVVVPPVVTEPAAPAPSTGDPAAEARAAPVARTVVGPAASTTAKTRAYGAYCRTESRRRTAGAKRSAFSVCVTALARVAKNGTAPGQACKGLSKKGVPGTKGTPFSRCVKAAKRLPEPTPVPEPTPAPEPAPEPVDVDPVVPEPVEGEPTAPVETPADPAVDENPAV